VTIPSTPRGRRESGQAAVEAALTLPLVVFMMLGTLQLFMLMQARLMAQYAAYQAARVGSITNGRCDAMTDAAILTLIPTFAAYLGAQSHMVGTPGQQLGAAFNQYKSTGTHGNNQYGLYKTAGSPGTWGADAIVWLAREHPNFAAGDNPVLAQQQFDLPIVAPAVPIHMEVKLVYWAPLQIPFADWVFSRLALAQMGILAYTGRDSPLQANQQANWTASGGTWIAAGNTETQIATQLQARVLNNHYAFPIVVTYAVRLMSPADLSDYPPYQTQNCGTTPANI
jgi:hypothetical protein